VLRAGLGLNWLADEEDDEHSFNFTYGGDWFVVNPLVISASMDLGTLGDASLFHFQATFGLQWRGVELYTGYDFLSIDSADTHLLVSGLRLWL
jgi:hypothetical protein